MTRSHRTFPLLFQSPQVGLSLAFGLDAVASDDGNEIITSFNSQTAVFESGPNYDPSEDNFLNSCPTVPGVPAFAYGAWVDVEAYLKIPGFELTIGIPCIITATIPIPGTAVECECNRRESDPGLSRLGTSLVGIVNLRRVIDMPFPNHLCIPLLSYVYHLLTTIDDC